MGREVKLSLSVNVRVCSGLWEWERECHDRDGSGKEVSSGSKEGNDPTFPAWVLTSQWVLETWTGHCRQTERKWPLEATRTECHTFAFYTGDLFCVSSVATVLRHVIDAGALKVAFGLIFTPYCMSISQTTCFDLAIKFVSCTALTCISSEQK